MTKYRVLVKFYNRSEPDWWTFDSMLERALFIISMTSYAEILKEDVVSELEEFDWARSQSVHRAISN